MPIDLPPLETLPPTPVASAERHATDAPPRELRIDGQRWRIIGMQRLNQAERAAALADARDLPSAQAAILAAYRRAGWRNVAVTALQQADQPTLWVIESRLVAVDTPPRLAPYFASFRGAATIRHGAFAQAARLAELHARRAGFAAYSIYARDGDDPHRVSLEIQVEERRSTAFDYSWGLSNTGNRFLGRNFVGLGISHTNADALRTGITLDSALPDPESDAPDTRYWSLAPFVDKVFPFGVLRAYGSYEDYRFSGSGRGRRPLPPVEPDEPPPASHGYSAVIGIIAEEPLLASPHYSLFASQGLRWVEDKLEREGVDQPQVDERFLILDLGGDLQWQFSADPLIPDPRITLGLRQSLNGLTQDLQADAGLGFTTLDYGFSAVSELPGRLRLSITLDGSQALDALPQYEEWVLGGYDRLNAWLPGVAVGDRGLLSRLELARHQPLPGELGLRLRIFAEYGQAAFAERQASRARLADAGIGLDLKLPGRWKFELTAAEPLQSDAANPAALQRDEVDLFARIRHVWDSP